MYSGIGRKVLGLSLCLSTALASSITQASTWVPIGVNSNIIFVPSASLEHVQASTFNYGADANIALGDIGVTSSVYYQTQLWSNGSYGALSEWQCHDQATLTANNNALKIALTTGRYKVNAAAVMVEESCSAANLTAFKAGELLSSQTYTSNEFMVINHANFDHTNSAIASINQPSTISYDLDVKWLPIDGTDNYQLNLNRDSVDYPLTLTAAQYNENSKYTVVDSFSAITETFAPHTGFGTYTFSVQYQLNGELSNAISFTGTKTIAPLKPVHLNAYAYNTKNSLPVDTVELIWQADSRTPFFKVYERNNAAGTYQALDDNLPGYATIVEKRDGGANRHYNHLNIKHEDIVYSNDYYIHACVDLACSPGKTSVRTDQENLTTPLTPIASSSPRAEFAKELDKLLVNPGQYVYVGDDSTLGQGRRGFASAAGQGGENPVHTEVMSEEILDRLSVDTEITAETTELLGEKIDLATGSVSFSHTDVSLPGNSGIPLNITREHKGGNYSFRNTLEFADWQLAIPSIHTTLIAGAAGYSGSWGLGQACSTSQKPQTFRMRGEDFKAHEYWNGTTLSIPGVTTSKLMESSLGNPLIVNDTTAYKYVTKDNWRISCLTNAQTASGKEGFLATSPQGISYKFDRYRAVQGDFLDKYKDVPRIYMFMVVSEVFDRFGNKVTYNYDSKNRLTSIVGQDVGEVTPRQINITYRTDHADYQIKSVSTNSRTWTYDYAADSLIGSTLASVTRPDNSAWAFDLAAFSKSKVSTYGQECVKDLDTGSAIGSITHPNGVKGDFVWRQKIHGRTKVTNIIGMGSTNNLIPKCFATTSVVSKTLSGPGLDTMRWEYSYSQNQGALANGTATAMSGPIPSSIDGEHHKWTQMTAPDGSITKHYFNRDFTKVYDDSEMVTDYYDTNGTTLLKRIESTYALGLKPGQVDLAHENFWSTNHRANLTQRVERTYFGGVQSAAYTTNHSQFTNYGKSQVTQGFNSVDNKNQYTRSVLAYDLNNWLLDRPYTTELSNDGSNWTKVSEKTYYPWNHASYKSLPYEEKSFGLWVKRYASYSNGNITKVEMNSTMDNGQYRYQQFGNYKMGKPQLITLPGRDSAGSTMTASLAIDNNGWTTQVNNFNSEVTNYTYDNLGRVNGVTPADNKWLPTAFSFGHVDGSDIAGDVVTGMYKRVMTKGSLKSITYFDTLFRPLLVKTTDTNLNISTYQRKAFNIYGKAKFEAYPSSNASETMGMETTIDGLQRVIQTKQLATNATETTQYLSGHKTQVTNYNGHPTTTTYLSYGEPKTEQMTRIDSPESVVTTQTYNLFGSPTTIAQGGVTQSHFFNARQQLCKQVRPDTGVTTYGWNTVGEVIWAAQGASGNQTSCDESAVLASEKTLYTHDNLGANKTVNYPDSSSDIAYTYDNQGGVKTLVAGNVSQTYNYFSGGALQNETLTVDGKNLTIAYDYDGMQSLSSTTYPNGQVVTYSPNAFGQATKAAGYATGVSYYPDGQVSNFTFGNSITHSTTLNSQKMPSAILASASAMNYGYTYDNQGNLKTQTDNLDSAYSISAVTYDGLDRLKSANGFWGSVNINYDTLGNITQRKFIGTSTDTLDYTYNAKNQLASVNGSADKTFTYDDRGNVTNNGTHTFNFNRAQKVNSIGGNSYLYDGHGRRVKRVSTTLGTSYSMYSQSGKLLYREKADGTKINYIFMDKQQVARVEGSTPKYIHTDLLGSPVVESDSAGSVLASTRMHYRPFGQTKETPKDEVGYTGHKFDADIGLSYMQQRYYDPSIGRFYSNDPIGYTDDNPVMSFNRYLYVNNNPYKYTDPDGRVLNLAAAGFGALVGAIGGGASTLFNGGGVADVLAGAGAGALMGATAGLTMGASLVATASLGAATAVGAEVLGSVGADVSKDMVSGKVDTSSVGSMLESTGESVVNAVSNLSPAKLITTAALGALGSSIGKLAKTMGISKDSSTVITEVSNTMNSVHVEAAK